MQEKLFNMLFNEDDVTWQTMIYELVKKEEMDPWDIDLSVLAQRFLEMVKTMKKLDFRVSGKIILAAAVMLRIKSHRLVEEDLNQLNRLIAMSEETEDDFYDELEAGYSRPEIDEDKFRLIPKTPQPRKRKVSVFDLVDALQKALEVKKRRARFAPAEVRVEIPEKSKDISIIIKEIYGQIKDYFIKEKLKKLSFSQLVPSNDRNDKVYTFVPLLHLDNLRKINLYQEKHLNEIDIYLK